MACAGAKGCVGQICPLVRRAWLPALADGRGGGRAGAAPAETGGALSGVHPPDRGGPARQCGHPAFSQPGRLPGRTRRLDRPGNYRTGPLPGSPPAGAEPGLGGPGAGPGRVVPCGANFRLPPPDWGRPAGHGPGGFDPGLRGFGGPAGNRPAVSPAAGMAANGGAALQGLPRGLAFFLAVRDRGGLVVRRGRRESWCDATD